MAKVVNTATNLGALVVFIIGGHVWWTLGLVLGVSFETGLIGMLVFLILMIINMIVIVKGTGRVSEVTARFTLDAMPGKQMAIDADLNAGVLTHEQARKRREDVSRESDFYGSMDGATKFVKGDAIAGILILAVNVIGGLVIGVMQHGLALSLITS